MIGPEHDRGRAKQIAPNARGSDAAPVRARTALARASSIAWDLIGLGMAVSLSWTAVLMLALSAGLLVPRTLPLPVRDLVEALLLLVPLAPITAGAYSAAWSVVNGRPAEYQDLWRGGWRLKAPAIRLGGLHMLVWSIAAVSAWFYSALGGLFGTVAALLCGYALLVWAMLALYHGPLLVAQEAGVFDEPGRPARRGALAVVRRSFFVALGHPGYTLAIGIVCVILTAAFWALAVPGMLLWVWVVSLLGSEAARALLVRYGVLPTAETAPLTEDLGGVPEEASGRA